MERRGLRDGEPGITSRQCDLGAGGMALLVCVPDTQHGDLSSDLWHLCKSRQGNVLL